MLDGVTLRSYTVTLGQTNTLTIGSEAWLKVVNGSHTLKIVATDAKDASVTRTLTFTKAVTSVEFEQTLAMEPTPCRPRPSSTFRQFPGRLHASGLDLQQRQRREPDVGGHHAEGPHRPEALFHQPDQDGRSVGRQGQGQAAPRLRYGDLLHPVDRR